MPSRYEDPAEGLTMTIEIRDDPELEAELEQPLYTRLRETNLGITRQERQRWRRQLAWAVATAATIGTTLGYAAGWWFS